MSLAVLTRLPAAAALLLCGCYPFARVIRADPALLEKTVADVQLYEPGSLPHGSFEPLGKVTGTSCQLDSSDERASDKSALRQLRYWPGGSKNKPLTRR